MLLAYITSNYLTLLILMALTAIMLANRRVKLPASEYFYLAILVMLVLTLSSFLTDWAADAVHAENTENIEAYRQMRWIASIADNILRPVPIMLELMLIAQKPRLRRLCTIPSALNLIVYITAPFTDCLVFGYGEADNYIRGPLGFTVYYTQFFYLVILLICSTLFFRRENKSHSLILILVFIFAIVTAIFESKNILTGQTNAVTSIFFLLYYYYLALIYQTRILDDLAKQELQHTKDELIMLRSQIQPHFILNSLALIRSMAKRDKAAAVECIDCFSEYLKLHLRLIQSDDMIPFLDELENVQVYITLAQMDYTRKMDIVYDLGVTDFRIPALSLEPIVENALRYGISKDGGTVTISTTEQDGVILICISDTGCEEVNITETESTRLGIGLDNTRKRLALQCQGSLSINIATTGTKVYITIPRNEEQSNEHSDS